MSNNQNNLEPLPKLKFDKKRKRVKLCPCGKENKDGKFVPYVGFENKGYCHSCGETFLPELPPMKTKCFNVPFITIIEHKDKTYKIKCSNGVYYYIPKSQVFEKLNNSCYVSEWYLLNDKEPTPYLANDIRYCTKDNAIIQTKSIKTQPQTKPVSFIPVEVFKASLKAHGTNHFVQWLGNTQRGEFAFDDKTINNLIESYFIANSNKYKGWVMFPYIDINGKIRDIKAMDYNPNTGKRIATKNGDIQNRCYFIGKEILNNPEANTERCFYGEHLLKGNNKLVRIFESEATATHSAPYFPESVCIATGGNNGCNWTEKGKCSVLKGRTIILYPDIDTHDKWEQKAEILRGYGITVQVSNLIKNNALKFAKQNGIEYSQLVKLKYDLRDILQHKKLSDFLKPEATNPPPAVQPLVEVKPMEQPQPDYYLSKPESWEQEIAELENYFTNITLPTHPVKLNKYSTITNCSLFIENHFATVKANNGKRTFLPYLNRLHNLKAILNNSL